MRLKALTPRIAAAALLACGAGCPGPDHAGFASGSALTGAIETSEPVVTADGGVVTDTVSKLDLLFVIDNSGSMANKQARLMREVTRMISIFTSGDRYAGSALAVPVGITEKQRLFTPVSSLHVGIVTSNAGGIDDPPHNQVAILSCGGTGDDGKLQNATTIAVDGIVANRNEFAARNQGDVVIEPDPSCNLPPQPAYQSFVTSDELTAPTHALACVARVGVRGCPFEQPLESMWKALAPSHGVSGSDLQFRFLNGTLGQGDRANQGFLREDAVLAVVILTDEDDCSITDAGKVMFVTGGAAGAEADELYGALNLRCGLNADNTSLIQPVARFVSGLRSLKPGHPERLVVTEIVGVPAAAIHAGLSYGELLALPEMQFQEDPQTPGFPRVGCSNESKSEVGYAGRRYLQLAAQLGSQAVVESICADDYGGAVDRMVDKVVPMIGRQ